MHPFVVVGNLKLEFVKYVQGIALQLSLVNRANSRSLDKNYLTSEADTKGKAKGLCFYHCFMSRGGVGLIDPMVFD